MFDILWIATVMKTKYPDMVKKVQGGEEMKFNLYSAFFAYVLMVYSLNLFVIPNVNERKNALKHSLLYGASMGLVIYGIYDFTAGGVFKDWDWPLAAADVLWGTFVYFISTFISCLVLK